MRNPKDKAERAGCLKAALVVQMHPMACEVGDDEKVRETGRGGFQKLLEMDDRCIISRIAYYQG